MSTPENPQDPYGQQPQSGGNDTPPPPPGGGYDASQPTGGYEMPPAAGGYNAPPPAYGAPGGYNAPPAGYGVGGGTPPPPNYLVWAILSTVFCCLPLGIASIVFSTQVNSKWAMGDVAGAHESSAKAKKFAIWAAIVGVIGAILYIGLLTAGVLAGGTLDMNSY